MPDDEAPATGADPVFAVAVLLAGDEFPDAGCVALFTAGDPFPAGVGEGEVLPCGAGDFADAGAAVPDFWPAAGVDDGLGFACWLELDPAPVFCAEAVAARTIASAIV